MSKWQRSDMRVYQEHNVEHLINNEAVNFAGGAGLILDMGLGKTVTTLTAFVELKRQGKVKCMIVIAPMTVCGTVWQNEIQDWAHLNHLRVSEIMGSEPKRRRAVHADADVYIMNRENTQWLVAMLGGSWPWEMTVLDESTSFKNPKAKRFKALKLIHKKIKRVVCLTGTFAPNTLIDLWAQMFLLDKGARLGETLTSYRQKYFQPASGKGNIVYSYEMKPAENDLIGDDINELEIYDKIGDICISMRSEDWLELPPLVNVVKTITLSDEVMKAYKKFERDTVLQIPFENDYISAVNAAALRTKLLQFSNGALYREDGSYHEVHNEKIKALGEIIEAQNGKPLLVIYKFVSDVTRIMEQLKEYKPHVYSGPKDVARWNNKEFPVMIMYPTHGLNLQQGGNSLCWFGPTDSLELWMQTYKRLHRSGQENTVFNIMLSCAGTMESRAIEGLVRKEQVQDTLMNSLKAIIKEHRN